MAGTTSKLIIDIAVNNQASKALTGISNDVKTSSHQLSRVGDFAKGAMALIGTGVLINGVKDVVTAASDLNETVSKTQTIFGETFPQIERFVADAATQFGLSEQAALDASATFGVFGKAAGLSGEDLGDFSTDLVALSADMASFSNTSPEEAIEALGSALRGETEPIRKYGVLLDDATTRQKALELGLVSTTKDALTPQTKALATQALIMEQTADAQGDFAKTSGGLAGQQKILSAQFEDTKAALGTALMPVMTDAATFMVNNVLPAFKGIIDYVSEHSDVFGPIAIGIGVLIPILWGLNAALAANPVILIVGAAIVGLGLLVASIIWAWNNWEGFRNFVQTFLVGLQVVWAWVQEQWPKVAKAFSDVWAKVQPVLADFWRGVQTIFGYIVDAAGAVWQAFQDAWEAIQPALGRLGEAFSGLWEIVGPALGLIGEHLTILWGIAKPVFDFLWDVIQNVAGFIGTLLVPAFNNFVAVVQFMWSIVGPILGFFIDVIASVINNAVTLIKGLAVVITWLAENVFKPVFEVLSGLFSIWWTVVSTVFGYVKDAFMNAASFIKGIVERIVAIGSGVWDWVYSGIEGIVGWVTDKFNAVVAFVSGVKDKISTIARGMWDGIGTAFRTAINFIIGAWNSLSFTVPGFKVPGTDIGWDGFTLDLPNIPYLATGGLVLRPTLAMVGERGPEAVIPLGKLQTGTTYNVNIQVVTTGLGSDAPEIGRDVVAAFRSYVASNGPVEGLVAS